MAANKNGPRKGPLVFGAPEGIGRWLRHLVGATRLRLSAGDAGLGSSL